MTDEYVVWRLRKGTWSRVTQPIPRADADRMCGHANTAQRNGDEYRVLHATQSPAS